MASTAGSGPPISDTRRSSAGASALSEPSQFCTASPATARIGGTLSGLNAPFGLGRARTTFG